jgi:hypothetical protein
MKLTDVVQQYHKKADRLVQQFTDEKGVYDPSAQSSIDYYRDSAARVMQLVPVDEASDEVPSGMQWNLESETVAVGGGLKFKAKDSKVANPNTLIEAAKEKHA